MQRKQCSCCARSPLYFDDIFSAKQVKNAALGERLRSMDCAENEKRSQNIKHNIKYAHISFCLTHLEVVLSAEALDNFSFTIHLSSFFS